MAYTLLSSYDTVRVLSPTTATEVLYCTIATGRHGAIVQYTVPKGSFDADQGGTVLGMFSDAVDTLMDAPFVLAAAGEQTVDAAGLIQDVVVFTIGYTPSNTTGGQVTTTVALPVTTVVADESIAGLLPGGSAFDQLQTEYQRLQALAGG